MQTWPHTHIVAESAASTPGASLIRMFSGTNCDHQSTQFCVWCRVLVCGRLRPCTHICVRMLVGGGRVLRVSVHVNVIVCVHVHVRELVLVRGLGACHRVPSVCVFCSHSVISVHSMRGLVDWQTGPSIDLACALWGYVVLFVRVLVEASTFRRAVKSRKS